MINRRSASTSRGHLLLVLLPLVLLLPDSSLHAANCTVANNVASGATNQSFSVSAGDYVSLVDTTNPSQDTLQINWPDGSHTSGVTGTAAGYAPIAGLVDASLQVFSGGSANYTLTHGPQCAGALRSFSFTAPATATAGTAFNLTVKALDFAGNPATLYRGTVHLSSSDFNAGVVLPANYKFTSADNGTHLFTAGVSLATVGSRTIAASDTQAGVLTGTSSGIAVGPGAASTFILSGPSAVPPGQAFDVTVSAFDRFGNAATTYRGTVHFTTSDGGAGSTVPANYAFSSGDNSVHTFTAGFTLATAGVQTITATDTVTSSITGNTTVPVAITLTVTSTADVGAGTLRAAVAQSNAAAGGAVITFQSGLAGVITYGSALPAITKFISIAGPGASSLALDGGSAFRIFSIQGGSASISGLTLQNGKNTSTSTGGGAIYNSGTLTIAACAFKSNSDVGFGGGGAISNDSGGRLTVSSSTFSANIAAGTASFGGQGGAIYDVGSSLTIRNSTFNGNQVTDPNAKGSAQGGAIYTAGSAVITNNTIFGNSQSGTASGDLGGGLVNAGSLTLTNTILAQNTAAGADPDGSGAFTGFNNFIGNSTGITGLSNGVNGNQLGTTGALKFPVLHPLGNYGGTTQTMLPFVSSPVLGAGTTNGLGSATDQRGYPRTVNGQVDIGAVQFQGINLSATFGASQSAAVNTTFAAVLQVTATETTTGTPLPNENVTYTPPSSGPSATLTAGSAGTGSSGLTSLRATANGIVGGPYNVTAALGSATANFALTNVDPTVATHFALSVPASATAGSAFSITVTAMTIGNTTATSYVGTVHFTTTDALASALPANYTFVAGDNGSRTFTNAATLATAGGQTITATDPGASITGTSSTISVIAGNATHFTVSSTSTTTAGVALTVIVTARDSFNNTATGYRGMAHSSASDSGATLPADYAFTAADSGVHGFTNGVTLVTAGAQTVMVSDAAASSIAGSSGIAVSAAAANHLTVSGPATATPGVAFNATVTARDPFNNTASGYTGTVHFTSSDGTATLPANGTLASGSGTFSFTLRTAGNQTISATDIATSSITGTSSAIVVNNPQPQIGSLDVTTAVVNSGPITLHISGMNFVSGATVTFNGAVLTPSSVVPAMITVTIPNSLLGSAQANVPVVVVNPSPAVAASSPASFAIVDSCTYVLSATSASAVSDASTGSLTVTAPPTCGWFASSNSGFLSVTSGSPNNGNQTVTYSVTANTGPVRTGTLTVAQQTFTITQASGLLELDTAAASGSPGGVARVPINLSLSTGTTVTTLQFGLTVSPSGGAPPPTLTGQLAYQAATGQPAPTNVNPTGANQITVIYTNVGTSFTGTIHVGDILVTLPSSGQQNQTYAVVLNSVSAMQNGNTVNVLPGPNSTLTITSVYTVGDIFPVTSDNAGSFGDALPTINALDLLESLRLTTNIEVIPTCSDRYDSADSWPLDTANTRGGGDGLNTLDLLETLRRATNVDTSRPTRTSRAACSGAAAERVVKPPVRPEAAEATLEFGEAKPTSSGNWQTPVYVHANVDLSLQGLAFAIQYELEDAEPQLKFDAADGMQPSLTDTSVRGKIALAWLKDWQIRTGDKVLCGYIETISRPDPSRPEAMTFLGASANAKADGREIKLSLPGSSSGRKLRP